MWHMKMAYAYVVCLRHMHMPYAYAICIWHMHVPYAICICHMHMPFAYARCICNMHMAYAYATCICHMHMAYAYGICIWPYAYGICICHMHMAYAYGLCGWRLLGKQKKLILYCKTQCFWKKGPFRCRVVKVTSTLYCNLQHLRAHARRGHSHKQTIATSLATPPEPLSASTVWGNILLNSPLTTSGVSESASEYVSLINISSVLMNNSND